MTSAMRTSSPGAATNGGGSGGARAPAAPPPRGGRVGLGGWGAETHSAARAVVVALRHVGGLLVQRVEDDALAGVVCGDLENLARADVPEDDAVVEEEGARIVRIDQPGLQARRREDEHLRVDRNLEGLERRLQVSAA